MPTALELTREEWKKYKPFSDASIKPRVYSPAEQLEYEHLMSRIRQAAAELKKLPGIRRVIIFGSFVDREWFRKTSDIDLAVEGIGEHYWTGWKIAEDIISERQVDFIDFDTASDSLRAVIEREGIEL